MLPLSLVLANPQAKAVVKEEIEKQATDSLQIQLADACSILTWRSMMGPFQAMAFKGLQDDLLRCFRNHKSSQSRSPGPSTYHWRFFSKKRLVPQTHSLLSPQVSSDS